MRKSTFVLLASMIANLIVSTAIAADSPIGLTELTSEHLTSPVGIGVTLPGLSWKLKSDRPGEVQSAYEIRAASTPANLAEPDLWSSGKIVSDQSVLVRWGGKPLDSRAVAVWQVRVWDKDNKVSDWSEPAS